MSTVSGEQGTYQAAQPGSQEGEARWVHPAGSLDDGEFHTVVSPGLPGWRHTSLRVAALAAGGSVAHDSAAEELVVVPLSGGLRVSVDGQEHVLQGRPSVWAGPTDVLYVPPGCRLTLSNESEDPATVALCGAVVPAGTGRDAYVLPAAEVPVELRGSGHASREVRNFGVPGVLEAERIIACEVLTPAGNWSSWPAHKHDTDVPGVESELEEIYWFDVAAEADAQAPRGADPVGYLRMHTTPRPGDDGHEPVQPTLTGQAPAQVDVLAEVRSGDTVLVPRGWHGPAMAPPGYDLYYLNVMAGPGPERAWLICDDPAHAWVRTQWAGQPVDPRLPFG